MVTEIRGWGADRVPDGFSIAAREHDPDPYWWEHHQPDRLVGEFELGRQVLRGPARIVSTDPLVVVVTEGEADD